MRVIEYLQLTAAAYIQRAKQELALDLAIMYGENETGGYVEIVDAEGRGVTVQMEYKLLDYDEAYYVPTLSPETWDQFVREVKPWRFDDASPSSM